MKRENMIELIEHWITDNMLGWFSNNSYTSQIFATISFVLSYSNINETIKFIMLLLSLFALILTVIGKIRDNRIKKITMDKLKGDNSVNYKE